MPLRTRLARRRASSAPGRVSGFFVTILLVFLDVKSGIVADRRQLEFWGRRPGYAALQPS